MVAEDYLITLYTDSQRGPVSLNHILHLIIQSRTHLFAMETAESVAESCPPLALIAPCEVTDLMHFCLPS